MFLILRYKMRKPSVRSKIAATIATAGFARVQEIHRPDCVCATALPRQSATSASGHRNKHFYRLG